VAAGVRFLPFTEAKMLISKNVNLAAANQGSDIATATFDEEKLKSLLKSAVAEALGENGDLVPEIVVEVMEDITLARVTEQGLGGARSSFGRHFIYKIGENNYGDQGCG
jgi:hypothetical protein